MKKHVFLLTLILLIAVGANTFAMTYYEKLDFVTGIVTASALNVRCGPSTNYKSIGLVYRNEYVRVFAKVGDWYVIQTDGDLIGAVSNKYIKAINSQTYNTPTQNTVTPKTNTNTNTRK